MSGTGDPSDAEGDLEREFLSATVPILGAVAVKMCRASGDPYGWAFMTLSIAAEKIAYEARTRTSAEEYIALRARVAQEIETFRAMIETDCVQGRTIVAAAIAEPTDKLLGGS